MRIYICTVAHSDRYTTVMWSCQITINILSPSNIPSNAMLRKGLLSDRHFVTADGPNFPRAFLSRCLAISSPYLPRKRWFIHLNKIQSMTFNPYHKHSVPISSFPSRVYPVRCICTFASDTWTTRDDCFGKIKWEGEAPVDTECGMLHSRSLKKNKEKYTTLFNYPPTTAGLYQPIKHSFHKCMSRGIIFHSKFHSEHLVIFRRQSMCDVRRVHFSIFFC